MVNSRATPRSHDHVPDKERRYSEITRPTTTLPPPDPDMIAGSSLSGLQGNPDIKVVALQSARKIVQSILNQITLHDSPPINEGVSSKPVKNRPHSRLTRTSLSRQQHGIALSSPSESSTTSSESGTLRSASIDQDETLPTAQWKMQQQHMLRGKHVEKKMGHGALASLCHSTLEYTAAVMENQENVMPPPQRVKPALTIDTGVVQEIKVSEDEHPPLLGESLLPLSTVGGLSVAPKRENFGDPPALEYTAIAMPDEGLEPPTPAMAKSFDSICQMPSDDDISPVNERRLSKDPPLVDGRDPTPTFERSHDVDFEEDLPLVHSLSTEDDVLAYPPQFREIMPASSLLSDTEPVFPGLVDTVPFKLPTQNEGTRLQMFGSEYARFLSETPLAPKHRKSKMPIRAPRHSNIPPLSASRQSLRTFALETASDDVASGAVTDIVVTRGATVPPKGYYRISQTFFGEDYGGAERKRREVHIHVKKEPNWDRAAQRPCVTALTVIFPDRKEFVPPGFCVVSFYDGTESGRISKLSAPVPADLNLGVGSERVYLCYRRSREGNPLTGLIPLLPSRRDPIPEGYTVLERSPRNHVADLNPGGNFAVFLAFRQRLATLEPLRPLPLLISIYNDAITNRSGPLVAMEDRDQHYHSMFRKVKLRSYYCTGGTTVASRVGKFHIMDRSTHALLSPSSIKNRLSLIQASRSKAGSVDGNSTIASSLGMTTSLNLDELHSVNHLSGSYSIQTHQEDGEHVMDDDGSLGDGSSLKTASSMTSNSFMMGSQEGAGSLSNLFSKDDIGLQYCLRATAFIPTIEAPPCEHVDRETSVEVRTAILTPILTACYTQHGGSAMLAVQGLDYLLNSTDFFSPDISSSPSGHGSEARLTLLDLAIQSVCDIATSTARETSFVHCIDFVKEAVSYARGHLNGRTIGCVLRFYLFVFYFGASVPTSSTACNTVWPTLPHLDSSTRSSVAAKDVPFLLEVNGSDYLPGGAPQAAVLAIKHLISLLMNRLVALSHLERMNSIEGIGESASQSTDEHPVDGSVNKADASVQDDWSVRSVNLANFAQLALHQIHRSGGSELFWYDMMTCCGNGLFEGIKNLGTEARSVNMIIFSVLANLVKVSSGRMRQLPNVGYIIPRDVASKMVSLEMLLHFIDTFRQCAVTAKLIDSMETAGHEQACSETTIYSMRRLVVPCLLANTIQGLQDARVFRRLLHIITETWKSPMFRQRMKLEIGVLIDQFALRVLSLGPQLLSPEQMNIKDQSDSEHVQPLDAALGMFSEPLFNHQVDLLFEVNRWFQGDARSLVEFFLNFDTDISLQNDGPNHWMPGSQAKLCERLCGGICWIAEQSGNVIASQIKESHVTNQGPLTPPSKSAPSDFSTRSRNRNDAEEDEPLNTEAAMVGVRVASRKVQQSSFTAAVQIARCLALAAATAAGREEAKIVRRSLSEDEEISFEGDAFAPVRQSDQHSATSEARDGDQSILSYWRTAIAAERRRRPPSRQSGNQKDTQSPSVSRLSGENVSSWGHPSASEGATEETLRAAFLIVDAKSLKKGVEYLIKQDFLSSSPRDVATFLRVHHARLNPKSLGEYLGEGGGDEAGAEFLNLVRFHYVRAISFVGMTVEQGLRHFLTSCGFRLPGEAQQIDRVMTTFSQCYWEDNAGDYYRCPFDDQDTVFLLSFAIIMLNTDLHKQSLPTKSRSRRQRKKMTKVEFLNNLRDVARDDALSQEYLSVVYDSVEAYPIQLFEEVTSLNPALTITTLNCACIGVAEPGRLGENLKSILKNVKKSEELLRGLSVHEFRFYTIEDYAEYMASSKMDALMDLSHSAFACTSISFHRLIKATVNIAPLDPQSLILCLPLLHHCLCATICLDMMQEFRSFALHLARIKTFAEKSTIVAPSFQTEEWYSDLIAAIEQNDKPTALEQLKELMDDMEEKLKVDSCVRKQMMRVVRRIREGQFLLNDPSRIFCKEGYLLKKSHRMGRSAKYHFFLFSDLLIYAKPAAVAPGEELYYLIHEVLALPPMTVVDWFPGSKRSIEKSFSIHHPRKSFTVVCDTVGERKGWVDAIRKCIRESQRRVVQLEEARRNVAEPPAPTVPQDITKPSCI